MFWKDATHPDRVGYDPTAQRGWGCGYGSLGKPCRTSLDRPPPFRSNRFPGRYCSATALDRIPSSHGLLPVSSVSSTPVGAQSQKRLPLALSGTKKCRRSRPTLMSTIRSYRSYYSVERMAKVIGLMRPSSSPRSPSRSEDVLYPTLRLPHCLHLRDLGIFPRKMFTVTRQDAQPPMSARRRTTLLPSHPPS